MALDSDMKQKIDAFEAEVKTQVRGQWVEVLDALTTSLDVALKYGPRKHSSCPLHQGKTNENFRFLPSYATDGKCICNTCGQFDGWEILRKVNAWGWVEAVNAVGEFLRIPHPLKKGKVIAPRPITRIIPVYREDPALIARKDADAKKAMNEAWLAALPLSHPKAEFARNYLAARQLPALPARVTDVRAHPGMEYWHYNEVTEKREKIGVFPTLLAMFRDPAGKPVTLHRIYLAPDGSSKANVPGTAKKSMSVCSDQTMVGGAVRIDSEVKSVLAVGEGLESSLAARAMHGLPTWSILTAGLMEHLVIPESVKIVIYFNDRDRSHTGQSVGEKGVIKCRAMGLQAAAYEPPFEIPEGAKSVDWADVIEAYGWAQAQKEDFNQLLLAKLAKELKNLNLSWDDVF